MTSHADALAADRAFVVQFRSAPGDTPLGALGGRVEHVQSGEVRHFGSLAELLWFLEARIAAAPGRARTAGAGRGGAS